MFPKVSALNSHPSRFSTQDENGTDIKEEGNAWLFPVFPGDSLACLHVKSSKKSCNEERGFKFCVSINVFAHRTLVFSYNTYQQFGVLINASGGLL